MRRRGMRERRMALRVAESNYQRRPPERGFVRRKGPNMMNCGVWVASKVDQKVKI
jgi:hypothetical protein